MNARIWLVLSLLAFGISLQNSFGDAPTPAPAGSNTLQVALPNSALTNGASINIGTFVGQGSAPEHQADWYSPLSEFLKALLWVGLIAWVVKCFKKEIGALLPKLKSLRALGGEAGFAEDALANQQKNISASKPETTSAIPPVTPPVTSPAASPEVSAEAASPTTAFEQPDKQVTQEFEIARATLNLTLTEKEVFEKIQANVKTSKFTPEQNITLGAMTMARVAVIGDFWRIYSFIYGSQLAFLQQVNASPLREADTVVHWLSLQDKFPALVQNSNRELYFQFLKANALIVVVENTYRITIKGQEFLTWCILNNLSLNKAF